MFATDASSSSESDKEDNGLLVWNCLQDAVKTW